MTIKSNSSPSFNSSMAFKHPKHKPFLSLTSSLIILFLITLLFLNIHYLRSLQHDFQNAITNPRLSRNPEWFEAIAKEFGDDENINIGLVNMDETTMVAMDEVRTQGKMVEVHFDPVNKSIEWSNLFPKSISEEYSSSVCPELPMPMFEKYEELDVVVARVPCSTEYEESGFRDVLRLQLNLVVANLLIRSGRNGVNRAVFAVFIGSCEPMWEIFRCDDLLLNIGNYWVYKPQVRRMKQKLLMPVGSCQLSPPFAQYGEELWRESARSPNYSIQQPREAYVTILHSSDAYVCGAIALAHSIIRSNTAKDLVLIADNRVSSKSLEGLESAGWKIKRIQRIRSPYSKKNSYNEWNYSKLRLWQLTEYDKVMFIDADFIVTRNMDEFFIYPEISAVRNHDHMFNSGLMIVEPSMCTFKTLMKKRWVVSSYNGGDQGFLNEMFPWWHRLPKKMNVFKIFDSAADRTHELESGDSDLYAIHYFGFKPWMCYRDYDCNWDRSNMQRYASDSAHQRWWEVHDAMPEKLREFCSLTPQMEAMILKHRREAKHAGLSDFHWKIKINDTRRSGVSRNT